MSEQERSEDNCQEDKTEQDEQIKRTQWAWRSINLIINNCRECGAAKHQESQSSNILDIKIYPNKEYELDRFIEPARQIKPVYISPLIVLVLLYTSIYLFIKS